MAKDSTPWWEQVATTSTVVSHIRNAGFQFQGPRFQFWNPSCQFRALVLNPGMPVLNSWPWPPLHVDNLHCESPAKVTPWHPVFASAEATRLSHAVARSRAPPLRKCTKSSLPARKRPEASSASRLPNQWDRELCARVGVCPG